MQSKPPLSQRPNISADLANTVREMVTDGVLEAGERINEVHLAARLGVSRTPLREALMKLVADDTLISQPRRGFFVRPLTRTEFDSLYGIRALLDPEALRLAGIPSSKSLAELERLNSAIAAAGNVDDAITIDDQWHLELVSACPNPILIDLIRQFMRRTRRYENAYFKQQQHQSNAIDEHKIILNCLRAGDLEGACKGLHTNLVSGIEPIIAWLDGRAQGAS